MNSFCKYLKSSLNKKFRVEADVYVSKKKKLVHVSFLNPLISFFFFFDDIVEFIESTGT